jgi:DNA repair exonuclease SbcCD ATPase subunit
MFERIKATNLFSWESLDYEVKPGISQITGFNYDDSSPEGCGKSSIPNILCWVLFGGVPKDVRVDEVVRQGCKSGAGEVTLSSGHRVVRSRKPNDVYVVDPSGNSVKGKDAKETQLLINRLIGLDFDAFCQTVYFAQNYPKKFVSSSDTEKVSILSQVLDLTLFDKARDRAHDLAKKAKGDVAGLELKKTEVGYMLEKLRSNAELLVRFVEKFEEDKAAKVEALKKGITSLEEQLLTKEALEANYELAKRASEDHDRQLSEVNQKITQLEVSVRLADNAVKTRARLEKDIDLCQSRIEKLKVKIARYHAAGLKCPTCGEAVQGHKVDHVFSELKELEKDLRDEGAQNNEYVTQLHNLPKPSTSADDAKALAAAKAKMSEVTLLRRDAWDKATACKRDLDRLGLVGLELKKLKDALKAAEASQCDEELTRLGDLDRSVGEYEKAERDLDEKLSAARVKLANLDILKTGFKEVKQFVFQALLNELSVKATRLAEELFEVPISIKFSNEDEEGGVTKIVTTVTLDGVERSLGLYSGGQYRRIELAVDLALASIVARRSQNPLKFRVLDEPFKDLSESSMEKVVKLLERLEGSTIIIEHNTITKSIIHNVFDIEYRGGVSYAS